MVANRVFISRKPNSLPRVEDIQKKPVQTLITWSNVSLVIDEWGFYRVPLFVRIRFKTCRGGQIRAFASKLKCGRGVRVPGISDPERHRAVARRFGYFLWERITKARGWSLNHRNHISRAEMMYCAEHPGCNLVGMEIHHINKWRTHELWKQKIIERLGYTAKVAGLDARIYYLTLDDRPSNLIALIPRQHKELHEREKTMYFGNCEGRNAGGLVGGQRGVPQLDDLYEYCELMLVEYSLPYTYSGVGGLYDNWGTVFISSAQPLICYLLMFNYYVLFESIKYDEAVASMPTRILSNVGRMQTML